MGLFDQVSSVSVLAAEGSEGGGAALNEIIGLTAAGGIVDAVLLWIGWMHRSHKITWLNDAGRLGGHAFKRPPWVALPIAMFISSIICALFGFIWDVSLHIGNGRDDGAAGQPRPLLHPVRPVRHLRRRLHGDGAALTTKPGPAAVRITRQLVRTGRRHRDGRLRPLRADRLPARRRLAPHLRPGRHAVGTHPPHDDRRRGLLHPVGAVPRARGPQGDVRPTRRPTASGSSSCSTWRSPAC